ncbi:inositol polyphosphate multikinase [Aspergillus affinis]|uniref:inositol polyphosphate multikinase n=1 Tax=Aspergillus affinis TaxID=1070780 RepID=UPI0022FEAA76|nr:arginine metabolism regulation protein iii [Aspergillus affinis]KAI9045240.1 arginine metabolism regulation protein iii [Aspergillus affinis]
MTTSSSRSESANPPKLDNDSFVAFDHAAAGHFAMQSACDPILSQSTVLENQSATVTNTDVNFPSDGVRCTPSGFLIAKPCTPEEVAFYESSALHPTFRDFMPTFMGTLSSTDQQHPLALAASQQGGAVMLPGSDSSSTTNTPATTEPSTAPSATPSHAASDPTEQGNSWVPSGGKKLDTGLSIVLENVASGFVRPNVLDVKLGARLWADDAPPAKRTKLDAVSKETTSSSLGFRIAGMKVWTGVNGETDAGSKTDPYDVRHEGSEGAKGEIIEKDGYKRYDKWYGRSFSQENVKEGFESFLAGAKAGPIDRSKFLAKRLADELRRVQQVIEAEESRMYSSSVLIVYEGDPTAMENALEEEKKAQERAPEESESEDEEFELELQEDESYQVVDLPTGPGGAPQQVNAINISIDPETAQLGDLGEDEDEEDPPKVHDLRLIDFAHASWTPGQGPDENVLKGIRNLIKGFNGLLLTGGESRVYRLYYALHCMGQSNAPISSVDCRTTPVAGTEASGPKSQDISLHMTHSQIATCMERLSSDMGPARTDCRVCIESAIKSTEAFDGIEGRPIITNIFGTAHAQFGNILVLSATYISHLSELIDRNDLERLLRRTINFLLQNGYISPALRADAEILTQIYTRFFEEPAGSFTSHFD